MKPERLASIWRQYVAHLAHTLTELGAARQAQQPAAALDERVEQLANEACVLLMRVSLCNPSCSRVGLFPCVPDGNMALCTEEAYEGPQQAARVAYAHPAQLCKACHTLQGGSLGCTADDGYHL